MTETKRILYLDLMRIIAILSVVFLHVSAQNWTSIPLSDLRWSIFTISGSLVRFAVPLFIMISGIFFLDPLKEIPLKKLYGKYIMRLIIAYVFWTLFYTMFTLLTTGLKFNIENIFSLIKDGYYHLWFLPLLIAIYILVPILRPLARRGKKTLQCTLLLYFIFVILYSTFKEFAFFQRLNPIFNWGDIPIILVFIGYFILGYYLYTYSLPKKLQWLCYLCAVISPIIVAFCSINYSFNQGYAVNILSRGMSITTFMEALGIFVFFKYVISNWHPAPKIQELVYSLSRLTFGIYLIHPLFLEIIKLWGFTTTSLNTFISMPLLTVVVFISSLLVTALMEKIPKLNSYII